MFVSKQFQRVVAVPQKHALFGNTYSQYWLPATQLFNPRMGNKMLQVSNRSFAWQSDSDDYDSGSSSRGGGNYNRGGSSQKRDYGGHGGSKGGSYGGKSGGFRDGGGSRDYYPDKPE